MAPTSKRKSMLSPSPVEVNPHKRRQGAHEVSSKHGHVALSNFSHQIPFIDRVPRPTRWRKATNRPEAVQPIKQSIYKPQPDDAQSKQHHYQQRQECTTLRFSFAQEVEDIQPILCSRQRTKAVQQSPSESRRPNRSLTQSFTNLSFDQTNESRANSPQTKSTTQLPVLPVVPELSKPKKQREGYGFSFSDSMFYDSDDYPDTECDWDSDTERDPGPRDESPSNPYQPATTTQQASSFTDVVVVRDIGSFHIAKPQKRLPCTVATREDTIAVKYAAKALLKYEESADMYSSLMGRLERMVFVSLQKGDGLGAAGCASKLCDFLIRMKEERVEMGEDARFVEHEVEWAMWLVEASRTGVMHLKGVGCECRPDWEED